MKTEIKLKREHVYPLIKLLDNFIGNYENDILYFLIADAARLLKQDLTQKLLSKRKKVLNVVFSDILVIGFYSLDYIGLKRIDGYLAAFAHFINEM